VSMSACGEEIINMIMIDGVIAHSRIAHRQQVAVRIVILREASRQVDGALRQIAFCRPVNSRPGGVHYVTAIGGLDCNREVHFVPAIGGGGGGTVTGRYTLSRLSGAGTVRGGTKEWCPALPGM